MIVALKCSPLCARSFQFCLFTVRQSTQNLFTSNFTPKICTKYNITHTHLIVLYTTLLIFSETGNTTLIVGDGVKMNLKIILILIENYIM